MKEFENIIFNLRVFGLSESIVASGYSMAEEVNRDLDTPKDSDIKRARVLAHQAPNSGEDNYLNGIIAQFDLHCSIKMWVELQRYHFIDFVTSQSTIHKINALKIDENCNSYVTEEAKNLLKKLQKEYAENPSEEKLLKLLYNIPTGFSYTARMTTNYRQLKTIYNQRKNHKLPEWRAFCEYLKNFPKFYDLIYEDHHKKVEEKA